ncbi:unnamed protein product [Zymoseptoria tritici ST99CH_3D7]|uniref:NAD(P)-binding protein n=1 Tax=Zymoseptoria tritici (strain ST99CH_3D7) TaxID=1276538 RepID=A0A1X7RKP2_ZYMT9|nr:unnamed protein product [Zymoseptoria tritici ST99CH_3D7]
MPQQIFFITGTSTGFGAELVKKALSEGDTVVATARNSSKLKFDGTNKDNFLAVDLDVTDESSVHKAFDAALKQFGRIDVVVNNAGYGLAGEFESVSEEQARTQFEVNFWGLLRVTRRALKVMRETNSPPGGKIQQVTSIGGQIGVPFFSIYCATKWAVEGFTETVSKELKPEWNIKLTNIEPGGFRTDWAGRSMIFGDSKEPAYDHLNAEESMKKRNGSQPGDPAKGARAMWEIAAMDDPPLRVLIGSDAYKGMQNKLKTYGEEVPKYEKLSNSTDVDGYEPPQKFSQLVNKSAPPPPIYHFLKRADDDQM